MEAQIHLCSVEPTDIDTLFVWENDRNIWDAGYTILPLSRHSLEILVICNMESTLSEEKQARFMIRMGDISKPKSLVSIGTIDIFDYQAIHRRIGCGIFIAPEFQGNGYGGKALRLLIEHGKQYLNLHQLYCEVAKNNERSLKLFKKAGFEECGCKKDWILQNGVWGDVVCLQMVFE